METMSYTSVRANFASTMQKVCDNHDPVIITRSNAGPVVMMSLEDYQSITETHYLLSSTKNAERLSESIDEIEAMIAAKKSKNKKK